jgi:hypothetical protein
MKTLFFTLILAFSVQSLIAQEKSDTLKHLTFKGVPIDGTLDEYVSKMKQNGFTHLGTEDGIAILNGEFAGYKECIVGISTLKQKDLVHKIVVIFPDRDTWSTLSGNYFNLKEMLTEKYGNPFEVLEKFDSEFEPSDDEDKMYRVEFDNCKYYSIWQTDKGDIKLSIDHESVYRCFVSLSYFDKINSDKIKAKAIKDL